MNLTKEQKECSYCVNDKKLVKVIKKEYIAIGLKLKMHIKRYYNEYIRKK